MRDSNKTVFIKSTAFIKSILAFLIFALAAHGQPIDAPHNDRGFSANKIFEIGDIDHISPFDGNLILTIPIGQQYPLRPGFSYGLNLFYNGKVWDVEYEPNAQDSSFYRIYEPHQGYNAGVGWTLSLGQLVEPQAVINDGNSRWAYIGPDGSKHDFYTELHPGESQSGSSFTRDNSYLRMRVVNSQRRVDMPDGSRHFFEDANDNTGIWRLKRMEDAFGNWMEVAYTNTTWTITDMHERSHTVTFTSASDPLDRVVDKVEVERFGSSEDLAEWDFVYDDISLDPGECGLTTDPLGSPRFDMKFLARIVRPDGSSFEMPDYGISTDQTMCGPETGRIRSMTLPTEGEIEWEYGAYVFPRESCQSCAGNFTPNESVSGVITRRHRNPSGGLIGIWTYDPDIDTPIEGSERKTTVTLPQPLGHQTVYYFSVNRHEQSDFSDAWTRYEYGLPLTHNRRLADDFPSLLDGSPARPDLYLSREIFDSDGTLMRSMYVRYEREAPLSTELADVSNANRRLQHELTIYHDYTDTSGSIAFTETINSDFDGLGHYRTQTRRGNFSSLSLIESKEMHTEWNANRGELITDSATGQQASGSTFSLPPASSPWVLGNSTYTESRQGAVTRRVEHTYRSDGFLECQRTLQNGTNRGVKDVLQVFTESTATGESGYVEFEESYGGDNQTISAAAGCNPPATPEYKTKHTYASGTLESSNALPTCSGAGNEEVVLSIVDLDIDPDTGLATTSRDASGTPTAFTYDALSRLTEVTPLANPSNGSQDVDAATFYTYTNASGSLAPRVDIRTGSIEVPLTHQRLLFDGFGRLCREQTKMPDGWSDQKTAYLATGLTSAATERVASSLATSCGSLGSTPRTTYSDYDAFSRAETITPADGLSHEVTFIRTANWRETREVPTAINLDGTETDVQRISFFDSFGRLSTVTEASDDVGVGSVGNIDTEYSYDPQDRLTRVTTNSPNSDENQNRYFTYDGRGFLVKEEHPELGPEDGMTSVGAIDYTYDSRGNVLTRNDGRAVLRTEYDAAGRPTQVWEDLGGGERILKEFFYSAANQGSDWSKGQLVEARRHNYIDINNSFNRNTSLDLTTTQHMTYAGRSGRISSMLTSAETTLKTAYAFSSSYTYDPLGNVTEIDYPVCLHAGCAGIELDLESVTSTYSQGLLTGIPGYINSLTYHSNGMIHEITHANSRVDTTTVASNQMARPASMSTSGSPTWSSGTFAYDGAGNIKSLTSGANVDRFIYDGVDRLTRAELENSVFSDYYRSYKYDIHGNRLEIDRNGIVEAVPVRSKRNRLTNATYDLSGNLSSFGGGAFSFSWDGNNTLMASSGPDFEKAYLYTADDERLASIDLTELADGTVRESWTLRGLGSQVLRVFDTFNGSWIWQRDYVYRGAQLAASETAADPGILHYHLDHLGSPRLITTTNGDVKSQHTYYPFGVERTDPGSEKLKFTGHERDENGSLVGVADDFDYMHARYCLPNFGRFMSMDPARSAKFQVPQSWNRYSYALNSPLKFVDPDGRDVLAATIAVASPSFALPPFFAGAAPAAIIVGGGFLGVKAGRALGGFEIAQGRTIDSYISDFIATEILSAPDGFPIETGLDFIAPLASGGGPIAEQSTQELQKSQRAYEKLISQHQQKLRAYQADPYAFDNKGILEKAPEEIKPKIIAGRIEALRKQIDKQIGELEKILKEIALRSP